jgi:hypothetical protein
MSNKVVVMMVRTKNAMNTTELYSQTGLVYAVSDSTKFLSSQITVMTITLGKRLQNSQGKLTKQILNAILATKGC